MVALIEDLKLNFEENVVCWIGRILKDPSDPKKYYTEIYFRKPISENPVIKQDLYYSIKVDCSLLLHFVLGHHWNQVKPIKQNLTLQRTKAVIKVPKNSNAIEPQSLYKILGIKFDFLKYNEEAERKKEIKAANEKKISDAYEMLHRQNILIPKEAMYGYCINIKIEGVNYIFPVSVLAQYYYFKSTKLIKSIIYNKISKVAESDGISNKDGIRMGKVKLKQSEFEPSEIDIFSKIVLDTTWQSSVNLISNSIQESFMNKGNDVAPKSSTYYKSHFPCQHEFDMDLCGDTFIYNNHDYFFVYQILSENSDQHLEFDFYEVEPFNGDHRSKPGKKPPASKPPNPNAPPQFVDNPPPDKDPIINPAIGGNSNAKEKKFVFEIETSDTFKIKKPQYKILPKQEQEKTYPDRNPKISRSPTDYGLGDESRQDSDAGRGTITTGDASNLSKKFQLLIEAVLKFDRERISIFDFKLSDFTELSHDDYLEYHNNGYIAVRINYKKRFFYLVGFSETKKDTRDVVIYNRISKSEINSTDIQLLYHFIIFKIVKIPATKSFKNQLKKSKVDVSDEIFSALEVKRLNHTHIDSEMVYEKICRALDEIIENGEKGQFL